MESQTYTKELNQFEQNVWYFKQYSRILQEYRDEIAIGWDDNASKEINGQYLHPHKDDTERVLINFNDQLEKLFEMNTYLNFISSDLNNTYRLSQEIQKLIRNCKYDILKSLTTLEISIEKKTSSRSTLVLARNAMSLANSKS